MPNRATVVETSRRSHIVTVPSLPLTTTTIHHHHHYARLPPPPSSTPVTPTFGPPRGELVDTHTTHDRHVTSDNPPLRPCHRDCPISTTTTATSLPLSTPSTTTSPPHHPTSTTPPFCVTARIPTATSSPPDDNVCPTTTTASATSLPKVRAGGDKGGVGGNGRPREGTRAGEEGQGNDDDARRRRSPEFLSTTGAACVARTPPHSHLFTPPLLGGSLTRGPAYHPHAASHLTSFTPLVEGFFFLRHQRRRGRRVDYTLPPFYFLFLLPLVGELLSHGR